MEATDYMQMFSSLGKAVSDISEHLKKKIGQMAAETPHNTSLETLKNTSSNIASMAYMASLPKIKILVDDARKKLKGVKKSGDDRIVWFLRIYKLYMVAWLRNHANALVDYMKLKDIPPDEYVEKFLKYANAEYNSLIARTNYDPKLFSNNSYNITSFLSSSNVKNLLDTLNHFLSLDLPEIDSIVFNKQTVDELVSSLMAIEKEWQESRKGLIEFREDDMDKVLIDMGNGWYWLDLGVQYCDEEGEAMGHCGNNSYMRKDDDNLLSLRQLVELRGRKFWKPYATFIINSRTHILGEMKGRFNEKPEKELHPYIVKLLLYKRVVSTRTGEEDFYIQGIHGGGYLPSHNFSLSDLGNDEMRRIVAINPNLDMEKTNMRILEKVCISKPFVKNNSIFFEITAEDLVKMGRMYERGYSEYPLSNNLENITVDFLRGNNADNDYLFDYVAEQVDYVMNDMPDLINLLDDNTVEILKRIAKKKDIDNWKEMIADEFEELDFEIQDKYREMVTEAYYKLVDHNIEYGIRNSKYEIVEKEGGGYRCYCVFGKNDADAIGALDEWGGFYPPEAADHDSFGTWRYDDRGGVEPDSADYDAIVMKYLKKHDLLTEDIFERDFYGLLEMSRKILTDLFGNAAYDVSEKKTDADVIKHLATAYTGKEYDTVADTKMEVTDENVKEFATWLKDHEGWLETNSPRTYATMNRYAPIPDRDEEEQ